MKIWMDLSNSPHINFFGGMIRELQQEHEVIITCRPLANTIELLDLEGFNYDVVGKHYGKKLTHKAAGFFVRIAQLYRFLKPRKIDVAISHSSFHSPLVSRLIGARCIYLNDNEHAQGNRISFVFANKIMIPEFLSIEKIQKQWANPEKVISYPGVKEGVYLWYSKPTLEKTVDPRSGEGKPAIFVRPEPRTAQYYKGELNFMDPLLLDLKDRYDITLLPRDDTQKEHYRQAKFDGVTVPDKPRSLADIMQSCDLFIGAGGTMTREAAVLGIPTISIYQDDLLDVDRFLVKQGFMTHKTDPDAAFVINFFEQSARNPPGHELMEKGRQAYRLIKDTLLEANG